MILYKFVIFGILLITFLILIRQHLNLINVKRHDQAMFGMASLRREIIKYLILNKNRISKRDTIDAIRLLNITSYTISNHDVLYGEVFNFRDIKKSLIFSKKEIDDIDPLMDSIKNKTIKNYYKKFGFILFSNISNNISFFKYRLLISIISKLLKLVMIKKKEEIINFVNWYNNKQKNYSNQLEINLI